MIQAYWQVEFKKTLSTVTKKKRIMIQELREYSQSFLFKLLLGVICVTFVVSFGVGSFGDRKEVIAKVNGLSLIHI